MKITALIENTTNMSNITCEHGLSLFIETQNDNILFDTGASENFAKNASLLGVDLATVNIAVISHGHNDHGGGLQHFLWANDKATVFLNKKAFGDYYVKREEYHPIGLDKELMHHPQVQLVNDLQINEHLRLFSNVNGQVCRPTGNKTLYMGNEDKDYCLDDFAHEQNLVISECNKTVLICGCAHNGIINILERYHNEFAGYPDVVIGGFHLHNPSKKTDENPQVVRQIADYLLKTDAKFFTCHCTGQNSYLLLREWMGKQISYLHAGDIIELK